MPGPDQHRKICTLLAVALVMGAVATAEGTTGLAGSAATHEAVRQIRMVDRDTLARWISELAQPDQGKPSQDQTPKFTHATSGLLAALRVACHHLPCTGISLDHGHSQLPDVDQGLLNLPPPSLA